jgi:hypothetical protein
MIIYASYQSNDPKMGKVEYQLIRKTTMLDKQLFLETWDKMPTEDQWTLDQLKSLFNNGYDWEVVNDILTHRIPVKI